MAKIREIRMGDGNKIPELGLGTWQLTGNRCKEAVKGALEIGYRHIDTAAAYENERGIPSFCHIQHIIGVNSRLSFLRRRSKNMEFT